MTQSLQTKSNRQSNIELLRNVSMLMILMLHANFVSLGTPSIEDFGEAFLPTTFRLAFVSLSVVGVDIFVLISGWFGIKPSVNRTLKFVYQILFFLGLGYFVSFVLGFSRPGIDPILDVLQLSTYDWFIKSYFVLMIISPILNLFSTNLEPRVQRIILLCFFVFEAVYGWLGGGNRFFVYGYGPLHLIGLYILAQYLHYTLPNENITFIKLVFKLKPFYDLILYFVFAALITIQALLIMFLHKPYFMGHVYAYHSPFVVGGAVFLFLCFTKIRLQYNKIINIAGASSFAVYLFHGEHTVRYSFFIPVINNLYNTYSGIVCLFAIFVFLIFIYIISCLIDQLRIWSWNNISNKI